MSRGSAGADGGPAAANPEARRKLGLHVSARLTAWYCGLFSLSLAVLFGFVYWTLDRTVRNASSELLHSKVKEFADTYKDAGIGEIERDASLKQSDDFLIRISDANDKTVFVSLPYADSQGEPALRALELRKVAPAERAFEVRLGAGQAFDFANTRLNKGYLLQIGRNASRKRALMQHFFASCAAVTFPVLLMALAGGALMANRALRPLLDLSETVQGIIATGRLDMRIPPERTAGELRELVISFNRMLDKIEALVAGMRGVLDNVAHDLRTPITRLRGVAELALRNPADGEAAREALADCVEESERVVTMLNTLMDISEAETGAMKLTVARVDVARLAREIAELYTEVAQEQGVALAVDAPVACEVMADENRLRQALANLVDNAVKYTPAGGRVEVAVSRAEGQAVVLVKDTGIGIAAEDLPRIWERLYRADKSRSQRGLGLGLSMVRAIARAHAGECRVQSAPGSGSEFTLRIPAAGQGCAGRHGWAG